jgi:hypothetical protein
LFGISGAAASQISLPALEGRLFANDIINGVATIDAPNKKPICRGVIYDTHWSPKAYKNVIKDMPVPEGG